MRFCTVINCMDGRVQVPVIKYLQERFNAEYVDSITEAGPIKNLAEQASDEQMQSVLFRLDISVKKHSSVGIAVAGHHDCAGNPVPKDEQLVHLQKAVDFLKGQAGDLEVIALWVDENFEVQEINTTACFRLFCNNSLERQSSVGVSDRPTSKGSPAASAANNP